MEQPINLRPRLWVAVCGVLGLLGLLLAATATPHYATMLRAAAIIWFLGLGAYETLWRVWAPRKADIRTAAEDS